MAGEGLRADLAGLALVLRLEIARLRLAAPQILAKRLGQPFLARLVLFRHALTLAIEGGLGNGLTQISRLAIAPPPSPENAAVAQW